MFQSDSLMPWRTALANVMAGLEFRGGTQVEVKFNTSTDANAVRSKLDQAGLHNARIQPFGPIANNEFLIALDIQETNEQALDRGKNTIIAALEGQQGQGKQDLNNIGFPSLKGYLLQKDPLHLGTDADQKYGEAARAIVDYRDKQRGGVLNAVTDISSVAPASSWPTPSLSTWRSSTTGNDATAR